MALHGAPSGAWVCWQRPFCPLRGGLFHPVMRGIALSDRGQASVAWTLPIISTMEMPVRFSRFSIVASAAALFAAPGLALACCPSGGNGVQMAQAGLGEAQPAAVNLSADPAWSVYAFERDGVAYYQVNDLAGQVVLIIANIDSTFWTLPAGKAPVRTSLPSRQLPLPQNSRRRTVFQGPDFSLVVHGEGRDAIWSVESASGGK